VNLTKNKSNEVINVRESF